MGAAQIKSYIETCDVTNLCCKTYEDANDRNCLQCKTLLILRASYNKLSNSIYEPPLLFTITYNDIDVAKNLINHGIDVNEKNHNNIDPLSYSIETNNEHFIRLLIDANCKISTKHFERFFAKNLSIELFEYILVSRADCFTYADNPPNPHVTNFICVNNTYFVRNKITHVIELSIFVCSNPNCQSNCQPNRYSDCQPNRYFDAIMDKKELLHIDNVIINYLLIRINDFTKDAYYVHKLMALGADINAKNMQGSNALTYVGYDDINNITIFDALMEYGIDVNNTNIYGTTPLTFACRSNWVYAIKKLIMAGAKVNPEKSILQYLIIYNHIITDEVFDILIDDGIDINYKDNDGNTLIMLAISYSHFHIAKQLLRNGVDISGRNKNGSSVYDIIQSMQIGLRGSFDPELEPNLDEIENEIKSRNLSAT